MITSDDVRFDDGSCPASARSPNGFVCGVVEGFYGRPWTFEQRKHLFSRLNRLGLNTYVYAPKDDLKHRPQWRIPYNNEETDILKSLIESAKANKITFVYSLSPGIDIVYSKIEDVICVKSKFDQISVANEVYEYLGRPLFLFCPTEYCESRAVPSLADSEYLLQLGKELNENIRVLWTGRPVALKNEISGLLMNPNCKYELNFVPLRTFADWNASTQDAPFNGQYVCHFKGIFCPACFYGPSSSYSIVCNIFTCFAVNSLD
uniref:Hyaluronoglucosaminidase n=1 Tax=Angiostrongylus cantonensis TaxID=6313 RepID=A0A0K0DDK0_ANGCA